jgi:hypothetical protein
MHQEPRDSSRNKFNYDHSMLKLSSENDSIISLHINKPMLDWPPATELAEQITRTIIQPKAQKRSPASR